MQTRAVFYTAALFNWGGAVLNFEPFGLARQFGLSPVLGNSMADHLFLVAIALFGIGYWWVGRNPAANRNIVRLGLYGKIGVMAVVWGHFLSGDANARWALLICGDLIYSILFVRHLMTTAPVRRAVPAIA